MGAPRLDLAVLTFATDDDGDDQNQNQNQNQNCRAWPLAPSPPSVRDPIAALGYPMGWSGAIKRAANAARGGARRSSRWGEVLDGFPQRDELAGETTTHLLHTSAVASGESGGPLVNAALEVCGVHSFGDHFTGGERDVAVAVSAATLRGCFVRGADNLASAKQEAKRVGRTICVWWPARRPPRRPSRPPRTTPRGSTR